MVYVNRYDWSNHCDPGTTNETFETTYRQLLQSTPGIGSMDTEESSLLEVDDLSLPPWRGQGAFLALDAEQFDSDFMRSYAQDCPAGGFFSTEETERNFFRDDGAGHVSSFGTFVSKPGTEYEFGKQISVPCLGKSWFGFWRVR